MTVKPNPSRHCSRILVLELRLAKAHRDKSGGKRMYDCKVDWTQLLNLPWEHFYDGILSRFPMGSRYSTLRSIRSTQTTQLREAVRFDRTSALGSDLCTSLSYGVRLNLNSELHSWRALTIFLHLVRIMTTNITSDPTSPYPLPNPFTPLAFLPPVAAKQVQAQAYVSVAVFSVSCWHNRIHI
jgi:hypothetical protein